MTTIPLLRQRARPLTPDELAAVPWLPALTPGEREKACDDLIVTEALAGETICRIGKPASYWFGLVDGLLKMSNDDSQGPVITFTGVAPGGWFGEGTVLKREVYRYNIQALRKSRVAGLPADSFHWLIEHSLGFNRFVMLQLNERLGQFIAAREIDRLSNPDLARGPQSGLAGQPVALPQCG
jgi:CRP/FNR family cyclic AMP-dependent transcriptional regulator